MAEDPTERLNTALEGQLLAGTLDCDVGVHLLLGPRHLQLGPFLLCDSAVDPRQRCLERFP